MWPFRKEKPKFLSMQLMDIAASNYRIRNQAPVKSVWGPKNTIPGFVNLISFVVLEHGEEGYLVLATYSDNTSRRATVPYEDLTELYKRISG